MASVTGSRLIFVMSASLVLGLLGISVLPALLPGFIKSWQLSGTEAGWLNGIFFAGYMAGVPVLITLTDRIDARKVFLASSVLWFAAMMGFAVLADGFWSALVFRVLAGIGFAGGYMPGLKVLTDRLDEEDTSRAVAFYTASYAFGASISYYLAGLIDAWLDWRWAFGLTGLGGLVSILLVWLTTAPKQPAHARDARALFDFRPVFSNRRALGYILAYALHSWELIALGSWVVAFLAFSASLQIDGAAGWNITLVGALVILAGMPASIGGNELARRFGRRKTISLLMVVSASLGCVVGFSAALPFGFVVVLCLLYGAATAADSASVTAGTVMSALAEHHGATMAMHAFIGFGGAFLGPLAFGVILDAVGGQEDVTAWGAAFAVIALTTLLGPLVLRRFVADQP